MDKKTSLAKALSMIDVLIAAATMHYEVNPVPIRKEPLEDVALSRKERHRAKMQRKKQERGHQ